MHVDQHVQPPAMSPEGLPIVNSTENPTSAKQRAENDVDVDAPANMAGNQELDDQQGFQGPPPWMYHGPPPGWMGWFGGRGGGRGGGHHGGHRRARAMMRMFGPGAMGMMAAGGPPHAQQVDAGETTPNETTERHCGRGGGRGGHGGRFNRRRFWRGLVFGEDDDDVHSVAGHMEDCHIEGEDGGEDESRSDGSSSSSSGSSSSSDSSSSSSSDSEGDDDEKSSRKKEKKSKGKRKHGRGGRKEGRKQKEKQACEEMLADDADNPAAATSASGQPEESAAQGERNNARSTSECRRERGGWCGERRRHDKHGHGGRHHHHHHRHHGRHGRFPPHFEDMMMFGPPPHPGMFNGPPPPPGFFDGTSPPCPPGQLPFGPPPHGAAADMQDEANLAGWSGSRRSMKQLKKTAKKWRKANAKAWKLRAKMARQCRRRFAQSFAQADDGVAPDEDIAGEPGMPPPWVFLAHHFRRRQHLHHLLGHHGRRSGGRHQFGGDNGTDNQRGKRGDRCNCGGRPRNGDADGSNKAGASQDVQPVPDEGNAAEGAGDQTPMDDIDIEIAQEAVQEK